MKRLLVLGFSLSSASFAAVDGQALLAASDAMRDPSICLSLRGF